MNSVIVSYYQHKGLKSVGMPAEQESRQVKKEWNEEGWGLHGVRHPRLTEW
mgnify:CR=1 FL=1